MTHAPDFVDRLVRSHPVCQLVAEHLKRLRFGVYVPATVIAPSFAERMQYTDHGDLQVTARWEVKGLSAEFHSVQSFPYPDVIVDEVYKIDKLQPLRLGAYVSVNASLTGGLVIPRATRYAWRKAERFDKQQNSVRLFYVCPKHLTVYWQFGVLPERPT